MKKLLILLLIVPFFFACKDDASSSSEPETKPVVQVKRDFNMILKRYLDKYKIEIPYTKVDVNIRGNNGQN